MNEMDDFKRPSHPDFMDSTELIKSRWSGIRQNSISMCQELWIDGKKMLEMPIQQVRENPAMWAEKYAEALGINEVMIVNNAPMKRLH